MKKLTNAQIGKAVREGLPKMAQHGSASLTVWPDAPHPWEASSGFKRARAFKTLAEALRYLGAWDG